MAGTVLLNATKSEAFNLFGDGDLQAGRMQDSVEALSAEAHRALAEMQSGMEGSPRGHLEEERERLAGNKPHMKLWAPASRGSGQGGFVPPPPRPGTNGLGHLGGFDDRSPTPSDSARYVSVERYAGSDSARSEGPASARFEHHAPYTPEKPPSVQQPQLAPSEVSARQQATAVVEGRTRSTAEVASETREVDVRAAFSGLPKIKPHWSHRYMKILLVGESGLGKTTFVRNLFAAYARDASFPVNDASMPNAQRIFADNPELLCTEIVLQDTENKVYFHYLVQDTPGYGDSTNLAEDRQLILDYVTASSNGYLEQEQDPDRKAAMHAIRDTRVDVCLYFIPPHRLRKIDLQFISELAAVVPVVPVLAKADTMTSEELKEFRHKVRSQLHKAGVASPFSRDALEDAGARHGAGPFAVIGSNTMDLEVGRFWPVRKYPWGSVEAMLSQHSELPVLRRLLFETGYCELKEATEARFHEYRHQHCSSGGGVKAKVAGLARFAALAGGLVLAGWLVTHGGPLIKDETYRKETVRRVKEKVTDVVETAVDTVQDIGDKAQHAAAVTRSATSAAADVTKDVVKDAAGKARRAVETTDQRTKRLLAEEPRRAYKLKPWWQFWGE